MCARGADVGCSGSVGGFSYHHVHRLGDGEQEVVGICYFDGTLPLQTHGTCFIFSSFTPLHVLALGMFWVRPVVFATDQVDAVVLYLEHGINEEGPVKATQSAQ